MAENQGEQKNSKVEEEAQITGLDITNPQSDVDVPNWVIDMDIHQLTKEQYDNYMSKLAENSPAVFYNYILSKADGKDGQPSDGVLNNEEIELAMRGQAEAINNIPKEQLEALKDLARQLDNATIFGVEPKVSLSIQETVDSIREAASDENGLTAQELKTALTESADISRK